MRDGEGEQERERGRNREAIACVETIFIGKCLNILVEYASWLCVLLLIDGLRLRLRLQLQLRFELGMVLRSSARIQIAALNFNCVLFHSGSWQNKAKVSYFMGPSHKEFLIVLLRFTLVDKLNNESQLDKANRRDKWEQWRRVVKPNVNWCFIDSPINRLRGNCSTCRTRKWN